MKADALTTLVEHELKIWPEFFEEIVSGRKTFEIRENDRDFKVGDVLWLREYTVGVGLSGRETRMRITYMTDWKQQPRYVVLGLAVLGEARNTEPSPLLIHAIRAEARRAELLGAVVTAGLLNEEASELERQRPSGEARDASVGCDSDCYCPCHERKDMRP